MERTVATKAVNAGDKVRIHVKLPSSLDRARVSVWARETGYEFSPFVEPRHAVAMTDGRPAFARPFHQNLTKGHKIEHTFEFEADATGDVSLVENADDPNNKPPKVWIETHAKAQNPFGRLFRNIFRFLWRRAPA